VHAKGPETIESIYDAAFYGPSLLEEIKTAEEQGFDAVIVPCMADPGLHAGREIASIPVVGTAESSFLLAIALGHRFSELEPTREGLALTRQLLLMYEFEKFVASLRVLGLSVEEIRSGDKGAVKQAILREGRKAVEEDGADVIVLGCTFMAGIAEEASEQLGVPVIDPLAAAMGFAEMLVRLGLSHSKEAYMTPSPKKMT
jgi:allantoin racemase